MSTGTVNVSGGFNPNASQPNLPTFDEFKAWNEEIDKLIEGYENSAFSNEGTEGGKGADGTEGGEDENKKKQGFGEYLKEKGPDWLVGLGLLGTATGVFDEDAPTPPSAAETYKELAESAYSPEMIRKQQEATRQATFGGTDYQYLYQDPKIKAAYEKDLAAVNKAITEGIDTGSYSPEELLYVDALVKKRQAFDSENREIAEEQRLRNADPATLTDAEKAKREEILTLPERKPRNFFEAWYDSNIQEDPYGQVSLRGRNVLSSLGMEQRQRGMRLDEAKQLASKYDPTQFMSEDAKAAYDEAVKADPLAATLRTYYGNVLGDDPDYLRETGELIMSGMDPYRLRTSQGVAQAVLGTEREDRARKQLAAEGAKGLMSQQRADAIARYQLQQGTDWLSQVGLGPMTSTQVTPPDPTGAFFASFPAMQQQSALADYMQTPGLGERVTAFGKGLETIFGNPGGQTYGLGGNTGTRQV